MSQIGATIDNAPAQPLPTAAAEHRRAGTMRSTLGRVLRQRDIDLCQFVSFIRPALHLSCDADDLPYHRRRLR